MRLSRTMVSLLALVSQARAPQDLCGPVTQARASAGGCWPRYGSQGWPNC